MDRILSLLGLAKRAGKLVLGTDFVCERMANGEIHYIFVASDSSNNTLDKIEHKAYFYKVEINKAYTTKELNASIGEDNIKVIGIIDTGFSKKIKEIVKAESELSNEN